MELVDRRQRGRKAFHFLHPKSQTWSCFYLFKIKTVKAFCVFLSHLVRSPDSFSWVIIWPLGNVSCLLGRSPISTLLDPRFAPPTSQLSPGNCYSPSRSPFRACMRAKSLQSCLTLCDPVDYSPPGSSIQGILQARMLEWVAISFSRGSSLLRDQTQISYTSCIGRQILYYWAAWEAPFSNNIVLYIWKLLREYILKILITREKIL